MSLIKEKPCDYGECPFYPADRSECEYWCGEDSSEDLPKVQGREEPMTSEDRMDLFIMPY